MDLSDLKTNLLVQTREGEVLKVSTVYERSVTAELVYPVPTRTAVRTYLPEEVAKWRTPSRVMLNRYDDAWGRSTAR